MYLQNVLSLMPAGMQDRVQGVFNAVLHYLVELLLWKSPDTLPQGLSFTEELPDTHVTMLFNDEVHTYDQVCGSRLILQLPHVHRSYPICQRYFNKRPPEYVAYSNDIQ